MRKVSAGIAAAVFVIGIGSVHAGTYQAMCGNTKCTVNINGKQISTPMGTIPTKYVTQWGLTGKSKTNISTGIWTTVALGPLGLLGFFAKHSDYNFLVNGYNREGGKTSLQFKFKNNKPVETLIQEMPMVTGIGMGEIRTALEIKKNEGLLRKCWWGTWNCADPLEGKTIDPDNLFDKNYSQKPSRRSVIVGSSAGAVVLLLSSLYFLNKRKKESVETTS